MTVLPNQPQERDIEADLSDSTIAGGGITAGRMNGDQDIALAVQEVVQIEGSIGDESSHHRSVKAWLFHREEAPCEVELAEVPELVRDDANFVWIDLSNYAEEDLREVARILDLHPTGVHAALGVWQRPRLDVFGQQFSVSVTAAHLDSEAYHVHASQLDLFVDRNSLVSAHKRPLPLAQRVMARARQNPGLMERDSAYLLYIILDELLEYHEDLNEHVESEIETWEERALTDSSDDFLADLLRFKRYVFALSQLVDQHRNVFDAFVRPDFPFVAEEEMAIYFRDLEGRLARLQDLLHTAKEAVNGAFEIYVSQMSHRTNQVIKILTLVSTILFPISVILAFFATSFPSESFLHTNAAFVVMILTIVLLSSGTLIAFRRQGWI